VPRVPRLLYETPRLRAALRQAAMRPEPARRNSAAALVVLARIPQRTAGLAAEALVVPTALERRARALLPERGREAQEAEAVTAVVRTVRSHRPPLLVVTAATTFQVPGEVSELLLLQTQQAQAAAAGAVVRAALN
jgi:hypothetical protein